jgi:hypothetical protein
MFPQGLLCQKNVVVFTLKKILVRFTELSPCFMRTFDSLNEVRWQELIIVILGLCSYLGIDNRAIVR